MTEFPSSALHARTADVLVSPEQELADAMPHIVWTYDAQGVVTYFNRRWKEYTGLDLAESLRVGTNTLLHPDDRPEVARLFQQSREQGEPMSTVYRLRRAHDGAFRWHAARVSPLRSVGGKVVLWIGTALDIDDQRRLNQEQRFLVEASKVLGTSLDLGRTLSDVAQLVVPHLADWCSIDLLTEGGAIERPAVAHVDPSKVELAWELWRRMPSRPDDPHGVPRVLRTGEAELMSDIPDELIAIAVPDPATQKIVRDLGLRSSMCVPLVARERVLGALSLVAAESGRRYGQSDLLFAEEFARRIAIAVDNAQLYSISMRARVAAEAMAADVLEQSRTVEAALLAMRAERDAALATLKSLQAGGGPPKRP